MSEREPTYLMLNENEDFKLTAHVDSDGQQRIVAEGYLVRRKADGVYQTPLIPEMFFGENGEQLHSWSQTLTAGDHVVLRRDSGNPHVADSELYWRKVSNGTQPQAPVMQPQPVTPTRVATMELPLVPIMILVGTPIVLYAIYKLWWHK